MKKFKLMLGEKIEVAGTAFSNAVEEGISNDFKKRDLQRELEQLARVRQEMIDQENMQWLRSQRSRT